MPARLKSYLKRIVPRSHWVRVRGRWRAFLEALALDHSPIRWPWCRRSGDVTARRVHQLALDYDWKRFRALESRATLWAVAVFWPLVAMVHAVRALRQDGAFVSKTCAVSRARQLGHMTALALRYNCPPASYYKFRLFARRDAGPASLRYIHHYQICNLLPQLPASAAVRRLTDKHLFAIDAVRHALPAAPPIVAFGTDGDVHWHVTPPVLPACDLVLKAFDLSCGSWFERWTYAGASTWSRSGRCADEAGLLGYCRERSVDHGVLLQARLRNHERLAGLALNGLCTVRVVTFHRPDGPPELLMAAFRMPSGGGLVDNFAAGGIAAPVSLDTGDLGIGVAKQLARGLFVRHPDSGAPIAGVRLPWWPETLELVRRAHRCFADALFIGWDVVPTPTGPLLLEANTPWCVDLLQIPAQTPIGDTPFTPVFLAHLEVSR